MACQGGANVTSTIMPSPPGPTATVPTVTIAPSATIEPTATSIPATETPDPTPLPEPSPSPTEPPPTPADQAATFRDLHFGLSGESLSQPYFPQGTEEIFAIWNYDNMSGDDVVRRVWTKNGAEWLVREENWDIVKYGPAGYVRDISIFDFEGSGLEPALYELTLYVNDNLQAQATFEILSDDLTATSGIQVARVEQGHILMLEDAGGNQRELLRAEAIVELFWLPDGRQLLYVNQGPTDPSGPPWPSHTLWLVDTQTGEQQPLSPTELNVHRISLSDDGRYIRALAGTDFGDACFMDRSLLFLDLNEPAVWLDLMTFAIVLNEKPYFFFPADAGRWVSGHEFEINMSAFCLSEEMGTPPEDLALLSRYRFDLETMKAVSTNE